MTTFRTIITAAFATLAIFGATVQPIQASRLFPTHREMIERAGVAVHKRDRREHLEREKVRVKALQAEKQATLAYIRELKLPGKEYGMLIEGLYTITYGYSEKVKKMGELQVTAALLHLTQSERVKLAEHIKRFFEALEELEEAPPAGLWPY